MSKGDIDRFVQRIAEDIETISTFKIEPTISVASLVVLDNDRELIEQHASSLLKKEGYELIITMHRDSKKLWVGYTSNFWKNRTYIYAFTRLSDHASSIRVAKAIVSMYNDSVNITRLKHA